MERGRASARGALQFISYTPGAHGTNLFASNPASIIDVVNFLADAVFPYI